MVGRRKWRKSARGDAGVVRPCASGPGHFEKGWADRIRLTALPKPSRYFQIHVPLPIGTGRNFLIAAGGPRLPARSAALSRSIPAPVWQRPNPFGRRAGFPWSKPGWSGIARPITTPVRRMIPTANPGWCGCLRRSPTSVVPAEDMQRRRNRRQGRLGIGGADDAVQVRLVNQIAEVIKNLPAGAGSMPRDRQSAARFR